MNVSKAFIQPAVLPSLFLGGEMDSTVQVECWLHAEDDRWPPKSPIKLVTANEEYALAA